MRLEIIFLQFAVGIKFPLRTHMQPSANLRTHVKAGRSKVGFSQLAHNSDRAHLCHFPSRTSATLCLASGLQMKLAHTEPPSISAFYYDHPHALLLLHKAQCAVQEMISPPRERDLKQHTFSLWCKLAELQILFDSHKTKWGLCEHTWVPGVCLLRKQAGPESAYTSCLLGLRSLQRVLWLVSPISLCHKLFRRDKGAKRESHWTQWEGRFSEEKDRFCWPFQWACFTF